jgi:hypothetical protein
MPFSYRASFHNLMVRAVEEDRNMHNVTERRIIDGLFDLLWASVLSPRGL